MATLHGKCHFERFSLNISAISTPISMPFFPANSIPRRRRRKNMYMVCQKNTSREAPATRAISTPISMPFFHLTLSHGAAGAKTCIRCAPKKTQSRSDYFAGAKRHNIVSTVAKRLSRPFRHRFRCRFSSNSILRRRRRINNNIL